MILASFDVVSIFTSVSQEITRGVLNFHFGIGGGLKERV